MIEISIKDVIDCTRGELSVTGEAESFLQERRKLRGVSTDSRSVKDKELYVALKGEKFDGHSFVKQAAEGGAAGILAMREMRDQVRGHLGELWGQLPVVFVEDTLSALGDLAAWYRKRFDVKLVAVTGSSGKTTTKDMISAVLNFGFSTHKTEGNYNNLIGLPLTVFGIDESHEAVVLEMGMDRPGEISRLTRIGTPDVAVITNIGTAHIENLGSRENIFKAKAEIFEGLKPGSTAVLNGDDDYLGKFDSDDFRVLKFGFLPHNDFRAVDIRHFSDGSQSFRMVGHGVELELKLSFPGRHNVLNAMAAAICGLIFDMEHEAIQKGILAFKPSKLRMEFFEGINGAKIINDAYNANPDSMMAALNVLKEVEGKRRYAILGDMLELGDTKEEAHLGILRYALVSSVADSVLTYGDLFKEAVDHWNQSAVGEDAFAGGRVAVSFDKKEDILEWLRSSVKKDDLVLVKGSRGMKMELVADGLRK